MPFDRGVERFHRADVGRSTPRNWYEPYVERGVVYALIQKRRKARSDFENAVKMSPTDERANALLAAAKVGDWPKR